MWHTATADGVPALRTSDGPAGVRGTNWTGPASTSFPCGSALAASFDPDLVREVGRALGREARSKSAHVLLAPTVNLHRTPVGGRNFECFSEDPRHTAAIAVAYVEGVQSEHVACCIKHFVGNDSEFARFVVSSEIDERVLRELYLVPFEAAVAGGVRAVMTGYNRLNGTYCSEHDWLLAQVLRREWGFDGVVMSDWYGTHSAVESLRAGLDVEMPGPPRHRTAEAVDAALAASEVGADLLAGIRGRLVELARWTGADQGGTDEVTADDPVTTAVARRAAVAGSVLLRNVGALPLAPGARLALIGPYAATGRYQGGGSAKVRIAHRSPLRPALEARGFVVEHAPGCRIDKFLPTLQGDFEMVLADAAGRSETSTVDRLELVRQVSDLSELAPDVGATVTGSFVPDESGSWTFGVRAVGAIVVRVDGTVVAEITSARRNGSFFGFGSEEVHGTVDLVAGRACTVEVDYPRGGTDGMRGFVVGARPTAQPDLLAAAVEAARAADVAVVVVGTDDDWETEGEDRATIDLPGRQDELVRAVAATGRPTVVVVNAGSPVAMPWLDEVDAVLLVWFPGGQLGDAVADVLGGEAEPGGRLPVTFPRRLADSPAAAFHPGDGVRAVYGEGLRIGHRWYESEGIEPLFPFGFGLGYTTFEVEPVACAGGPDTGVEIVTRVTNTGERVGSEVVQVYVRCAAADPTVPPYSRFAGSAKVTLPPGGSVDATVRLDERAFASWVDGAWTVVGGTHEILVGRSSIDVVTVASLTV
jgi:beta-glucosidase